MNLILKLILFVAGIQLAHRGPLTHQHVALSRQPPVSDSYQLRALNKQHFEGKKYYLTLYTYVFATQSNCEQHVMLIIE